MNAITDAGSTCPDFFAYMGAMIERLKQQGREGSAKNYNAALKKFRQFSKGGEMPLPDVSACLVEDFSAWMRREGVKSNSISFYLRILRTVYLRAVAQGVVDDRQPFRNAYTKIEKTIKRAINLDDIRRIKDLKLKAGSHLDKARDIYLFLFYARGMSFIDAAYLRKTDVRGGEIVYCRHKTHRTMAIGVNTHIQGLIAKYSAQDSPYLLPILGTAGDATRLQYESALRRVNNALKRIAVIANLPVNLTTYTARHSWATIAKFKGIATSVISDALGHDSEKTTQIYLASISISEINRANDLILAGL